ncbi:EAL and HDOD domain-containing protein [Vreelandella sp. EE22]
MTRAVLNASGNGYTIALQPIVDGNLHHVADELLYRGHLKARNADITDDVQATARACAVAIYEIGLEKLCGKRKLFINVSEQWLLNPDLCSLPPEQVVLEILETTPPSREVEKALEDLNAQGYTLALDDFQTDQNHDPLLRYCDIVKLDVSNALSLELIESLKTQGFTLLAERVETQEEFQRCKDLGFSLFQGYFYERPNIKKTRAHRRTSSCATQLRLITRLYRQPVNINEIGELIAQDPYLVDAVLRRANSASKSLGQPSYRLNECIQRLGVTELRMLVTIVLLASNSPANRLNVINGLTRAIACEQVAAYRSVDEEEGFILGLFSHMPVILDVDMETLKEELPLGQAFINALYERKGEMGDLLNEVESAEQGINSNDLSDTLLVEAAAQARLWMDKIKA